MANTQLLRSIGVKLEPYNRPEIARTMAIQMMPNLTVPRGQILGRITSGGNTNKFQLRVGTDLTAPAGAPVPTAAGADGTIPAGTYLLGYSYKNANGETTLSPTASVVVGATNHIAVATIVLPAGAASANWYLSGGPGDDTLLFVANNNGTGFNITAPPAGGAAASPQTNTAVAATDGSGKAECIAVYDFNTDASGNVIYVQTSGVLGGLLASADQTAVAYNRGNFLISDLTGYDATVLVDLAARLIFGGTVLSLP